MKIGIPRERRPHELRVAATPDSVKKLLALGAEVLIESGAGAGASYTDEAYAAAGARLVPDEAALLGEADVVLKVQRPMTEAEGGPDELAMMKPGAVLIGILAPFAARDQLAAYAGRPVDAFALEFMPRITRAQSMDVLSSQSNLAGYRAVIDAAAEFGRAFPMMMTAAGTIAPAKVMVMGAGVAGLQAIATARRLGAVVSATDVRPAAKEQVNSLGATFVTVDEEAMKDAETAGGYAKEMSEDFQKRQAEFVAGHIAKQDIVITTALIPGRPAPRLVTADMVRAMKPGSVIVDLAVEAGGNCELAEHGQIVRKHDVAIVAHANVPSRLASDASLLYARNLFNFLSAFWDKETKAPVLPDDDEIVKGVRLTKDGKAVHPVLDAAQGG